MLRCSAERAGLDGCQAPVSWVLRGADQKRYSCGRHVNRVLLQMVRLGLEYVTVSISDLPRIERTTGVEPATTSLEGWYPASWDSSAGPGAAPCQSLHFASLRPAHQGDDTVPRET
jgi:hypothetical protein